MNRDEEIKKMARDVEDATSMKCPSGVCEKARIVTRELIHLQAENAKLKDKIDQVLAWWKAYPLAVFPEPDFKKAAKVPKDNGMTIDSISASNMRHVLKGVQRILQERNDGV